MTSSAIVPALDTSPPDASSSDTLGYSVQGLDRVSERRDDAGFVAGLAADPAARFLALCGDVPVLGFDGRAFDPFFALADIARLGPEEERVLLGLDGDRPVFAVTIDTSETERLKATAGLKLIDLRSIAVQGLLSPVATNALATAKALCYWHRRHRFCANCGRPTPASSAGWRRDCGQCGAQHFPRTDPVVIMLAVDGDRCLLGRGANFPEGRYSCLAGFLEPGETIEDAVRREILEESGIRTGRVRYVASQPWPFPASLMIGCMAQAVSEQITLGDAELADARWFSREQVAMILAGTHAEGITAPPPMAIAHHIMRVFVETGLGGPG